MQNVNTSTPIICLSSQGWNDNLWTNKQHLMLRLSQRGNPVLYVCHPSCSSFSYFQKYPPSKNAFFYGRGVTQLSPTLFLYEAPDLPLLGLFRSSLNYKRFGCKLDGIKPLISQARLQSGQAPFIWAYDPGYGHYLDKLPKPYRLLYDCVDDYASFPVNAKNSYQHKWIQDSEKKLLLASDVVTTTSLNLFESKKQFNLNTHYIHNVGDFEHFNTVMSHTFEEPDALQAIPHPRIGFFGAVSSYKLDIPLLEKLAQLNPHFHYCLLGPQDQHEQDFFNTLHRLNNVHFLGKIPYQELPQYIQHLDILMIPYAKNRHTSYIFPIKFFEYLATGKPVIATPLPAYSDYIDSVACASDAEGFLLHISSFINFIDPKQVNSRIALAKMHDWNSRLDKILNLLNNHVCR